MEKLTGLKKIKTAVFISGAGSNLRNLIKFSKVKKTPISIDLIISSTAKAKGLRYGTQYKIKKKIFDFQNIKTEEKNILAILDVGAYGMSMSSNYNSRPKVPEIIVDDNKCHLIKNRESFSDLINSEKLLP